MIIQEDDRIGGYSRYFFTPDRENLMLVPETIRDCAGFLFYKQALADPPRTAGTVFRVQIGPPDAPSGYFVTAKHVIDHIRKDSCDNKVLWRADVQGGSTEYIESDIDQWISHPTDETVDVAVLPMTMVSKQKSDPAAKFRVALFPLSPNSIASPEVIRREGIGAGDEVFIIGLFKSYYGKNKNIPVVRIGNIAAMPDELVETDWHDRSMKAYLIEARSIGGVSGSPVFVNLGPVIPREPGFEVSSTRVGKIYLLGLIHGHWKFRLPDVDVTETDANPDQINSGIAIVVPAEKILEVVNQPILVEQRRKSVEERRRANLPVMDNSVQ